MPETISIDEAERDLRGLLQSLRQGESITVIDEEHRPMAALTGLKEKTEREATSEERSIDEWLAAWDRLAEEVSAHWKGDKGAVETLIDMRGHQYITRS